VSIAGDIEQAVETAVPAARGARWAMIAGAVALAAIALGFALWWLFFRPAEAIRREGEAKVSGAAGEAVGRIADQAIPVIVKAEREKVEVRVITEKGIANVRAAPDAAVSIPGVSAAVRDGVLQLRAKERAAGAGEPVRTDDPEQRVARPDAGDARQPD